RREAFSEGPASGRGIQFRHECVIARKGLRRAEQPDRRADPASTRSESGQTHLPDWSRASARIDPCAAAVVQTTVGSMTSGIELSYVPTTKATCFAPMSR